MDVALGIDPGLRGGVATLSQQGRIVSLDVMPTCDDGIDGRALAALVRRHCPFVAVAAVELVHAMPKQGVASTYRFGEGTGVILGVLAALGIEPKRPSPQRWMKAIHGPRPVDGWGKALTLAWAERTFPGAPLVPARCRVAHDGLGDALALAWWALHNS